MKPPPEVSISNARPIPPRGNRRLFALIGIAAGFAVAWVGLRWAARYSHDTPPPPAAAPPRLTPQLAIPNGTRVRIPANVPLMRPPAAAQPVPR